jgi:hypothetical protein
VWSDKSTPGCRADQQIKAQTDIVSFLLLLLRKFITPENSLSKAKDKIGLKSFQFYSIDIPFCHDLKFYQWVAGKIAKKKCT